MNKQRSSAFSLAEMALVIVVIGILVVAIVGGRELVNQAKVKKVVSEFEVITNAYQSFRSTYDELPGDLDNAYDYFTTNCASVAAKCNGDGDGVIEGVTGVSATAPNHDDHESLRVFQHLVLAELFSGSYSGVGYDSDEGDECSEDTKLSATNSCFKFREINVQATAFSNIGYYIIYYDSDLKHVIQLGGTNSTNDNTVNGDNNYAIFYPRFAQKIDLKFDDAVANTGLTRGVLHLGEEAGSDSCYNSEGEYNLHLENIECAIKLAVR